uniref:Uncharacterized protein n=1 Tax=Ixodes ricinus TaxID=34613 RepID=A0A6B0UU97_IXORI
MMMATTVPEPTALAPVLSPSEALCAAGAAAVSLADEVTTSTTLPRGLEVGKDGAVDGPIGFPLVLGTLAVGAGFGGMGETADEEHMEASFLSSRSHWFSSQLWRCLSIPLEQRWTASHHEQLKLSLAVRHSAHVFSERHVGRAVK